MAATAYVLPPFTQEAVSSQTRRSDLPSKVRGGSAWPLLCSVLMETRICPPRTNQSSHRFGFLLAVAVWQWPWSRPQRRCQRWELKGERGFGQKDHVNKLIWSWTCYSNKRPNLININTAYFCKIHVKICWLPLIQQSDLTGGFWILKQVTYQYHNTSYEKRYWTWIGLLNIPKSKNFILIIYPQTPEIELDFNCWSRTRTERIGILSLHDAVMRVYFI